MSARRPATRPWAAIGVRQGVGGGFRHERHEQDRAGQRDGRKEIKRAVVAPVLHDLLGRKIAERRCNADQGGRSSLGNVEAAGSRRDVTCEETQGEKRAVQ